MERQSQLLQRSHIQRHRSERAVVHEQLLAIQNKQSSEHSSVAGLETEASETLESTDKRSSQLGSSGIPNTNRVTENEANGSLNPPSSSESNESNTGEAKPSTEKAESAPVTVSFGTVNSTFGKAGVNRIPPRKETEVTVSVSGIPEGSEGVLISCDAATMANGKVKINDEKSLYVKGNQTLRVKGTNQTNPGHDNRLSLVAHDGETELARSNTFSVAAYPETITFATQTPENIDLADGTVQIAGVYDLSSTSDSGHDSQMNKAYVSEVIAIASHSGLFPATSSVSHFIAATALQTDHNGIIVPTRADLRATLATATGLASRVVVEQYFVLGCDRTGLGHAATDVATAPFVPNSGFRLTTFFTSVGTKYFFNIQREAVPIGPAQAGIVTDSSIKQVEV